MPLPLPLPEDWTCVVCTATHAVPCVQCRRCGSPLLPFARIALAARALKQAGLHLQAAALANSQAGSTRA